MKSNKSISRKNFFGPKSIFCHFKTGRNSIVELEKILKLPSNFSRNFALSFHAKYWKKIFFVKLIWKIGIARTALCGGSSLLYINECCAMKGMESTTWVTLLMKTFQNVTQNILNSYLLGNHQIKELLQISRACIGYFKSWASGFWKFDREMGV